MKVLFITLGSEQLASSRTRVYQYLPFLQAAQIQYQVFPILEWRQSKTEGYRVSGKTWSFIERRLTWARQIQAILIAHQYDVIFIQKVLFPPFLLKVLDWMGKPFLFDFDDAIYATHQAYRLTNTLGDYIQAFREAKAQQRLQYVISTSRCIILENETTLQYANQYNPNILIITGPIDAKRYSPRSQDSRNEQVVIGWIGSPQNTVYLQPLFPVFQQLAKEHPQTTYEFIGAASFNLPDIDLRFDRWTLESEVENLHHFDIGIMPLPDDEWSRGKGGYKLLQYMALGIPSVASPVGINSKLIQDGETGFLASTPEDWHRKLSLLVNDPLLRKQMGQKARKVVEDEYSFEVAAPRLVETLRSAAQALT